MVNDPAAASSAPRNAAMRFAAHAPGVLLSVLVATMAILLAPYIGVSSVLLALLVGMGLSATTTDAKFTAHVSGGVEFSARSLLRLGVLLLGARVTVSDLASVGLPAVAITLAAMFGSLAVGLFVARLLGLERGLSFILAGATAICGASAAAAIAAALPKGRPADAAAAIAGVTVIGAVCMIGYPVLANALGFDTASTGVFLGASLHEVAQAVGAGFAVSPETGETATAIKLLRVACLGPLVFALAQMERTPDAKGAALPWFIIGFGVLAVLASFNLLPNTFVALASAASQWLLVTAIAALGLKTSFSRLKEIGVRPVALLVVQTLALAFFVVAGLIAADWMSR